MRKCFVLTALIAAVSMSQVSGAESNAPPKAESKVAAEVVVGDGVITVGPEVKVEIRTLNDGKNPKAAKQAEKGTPEVKVATDAIGKVIKVEPKVIKVGPDGKVEVKNLKDLKVIKVEPKVIKVGPDGEVEVKDLKDLKVIKVGPKVIKVGPDGKVEVKDLKDLKAGLPKEVLDKLPQEVREKIEKKAAGGTPEIGVTGKVKVIMIGPDGKRQEVESDIGPALGGSVLGFQVDLGEILKKAGVTLPPEAQQALEAAGGATSGQSGKSDEVSAKLDKILEHLERVEKDVATLKAKKRQ